MIIPSTSETIKKLEIKKRLENGVRDKYVKTFLWILRSNKSRNIEGMILYTDTKNTILG